MLSQSLLERLSDDVVEVVDAVLTWDDVCHVLLLVMVVIAVVVIRDVRNRFFNFCSVSVRFLKKTRLRFGMNLVRFGLQKLGSVRIIIYY